MDDEKPIATAGATPTHSIASLMPSGLSMITKKIRSLAKPESGSVARLQAEFLHVSLPLFFAEDNPVHSLGITSAVAGEGKTLSSLLISHALATNSRRPVLLVECDWERPTLSHDLHLAASPGLSEWLRGTTERSGIRHSLLPNLTIVTAGLGGADAMTSLAELRRPEFRETLADPGEIMILDLPSVLGSYYGTLAARLADALFLVVRAGATPTSFVTRAYDELQPMRVEGIVLNQVHTRVPRWLRHLL
ncbi:MAG TPA: CpsD/CapB family tyrosine-protein kinase [Ktedonobacterales bacterium]|nr:CpsD/CapB family tyrosine-protein kinase [Ktedonobacterales bacterium]